MYPKVRDVLPIVKGHEEIHDDMSIPRGALIGRDEVSKREIGSDTRRPGRIKLEVILDPVYSF